MVLKESEVFKEIQRVQNSELVLADKSMSELDDQLSIDTATWALELYELELGIKTDTNKPLNERRAVIKSRWRGTGKLDNKVIEEVIDSFTNGDVSVDFDGNIIINFNGLYGIPGNMEDVFQAVEEVKPAHLAVVYEYMFFYIKDIHQRKTLEELETTTLDKFAF